MIWFLQSEVIVFTGGHLTMRTRKLSRMRDEQRHTLSFCPCVIVKDKLFVKLFLLVFISVALLLVGGLAAAQSAELPRFEPLDECFVETDPTYEIDCGYVVVPEEHGVENNRTLRLGVVRVKSTSATPGTPMFMGAGGPGGSIVDVAPVISAFAGLTSILEDRDLVLFAQRGTQFAEPFLGCPDLRYQAELTVLREELTGSERRFVLNGWIEDCYNRLLDEGVNFDAFDSFENAADINDIRQALGYETIVYYGLSYGTILGQHLLRDFPEIVEALIFDGSIGLSARAVWTDSNFQDDQFVQERLIADCLADEVCAANYPNVANGINESLAQVAEEPLRVPVTDPEDGSEQTLIVDQVAFANIVHSLMGQTEGLTLYPIVGTSNVETIINTIAPMFALPSEDSLAYLMHYAVVCAEEPVYSVIGMINFPTQLTTNTSIVTAIDDAENYVFACSLLDVERLPDSANITPSGDIPVLFLNGRYDNATPAFRNEELAAEFPNSFSFEFQNGRHVQLMQQDNGPCAGDLVRQFINDPTTAPDGSCVDAIPPIQFYVLPNS